MCTIVFLPDREIQTVGELSELVGGRENIVCDGEPDPPENCLCNVAVPHTLMNAGYWVRIDECNMGYEARKILRRKRDE